MIEKPLGFQSNDPQFNGPQYLEDLATGYWYSQALFTAVELGLFTLLDPEGKPLAEIAAALQLEAGGLERFLQTLKALGLVEQYEEIYFNTGVARDYLVRGRELYQGESILWRQQLFPNWRTLRSCLEKGGRVRYSSGEEDPRELSRRIRRYGRAMDCVAKTKVREILPFLANLPLSGEILDVGSGTGAISAGLLEHFPQARATWVDIPEVLDYARELAAGTALKGRVTYCPANILEPWPLKENHFPLIILSNIVHAYAGAEISEVLARAVACLKEDGLLLIHDFFGEHSAAKAALFDLNMLVNTFNGRVFSVRWLREELAGRKLAVTELLPLASDTALLFASKDAACLAALCLEGKTQLMARLKGLGFSSIHSLAAEDIEIPGWVDLHCRFGCSDYGKPHCPPDSLSAGQTREMLRDYRDCLLIEGTPPTGDFQRLILKAEREAFVAGYYKAFALWAGPCSLCPECGWEKGCRNHKDSRPSLEGAGIDVFATVQKAGISLRTLADGWDYVKYFAILLLE